MTVENLIALLEKCNPKAIVKAWDPSLEDKEPVTSILFDDKEVEIQTDETS